ncbi:MAG: alpha/beta fold hydrolase [Vicinamibacterales bacterium]
MASASSLSTRRSVALAALYCLLAADHAHAQVGPNGEVDGLTAKFVDVNGVRTRYYDYGEGDAIVLAGVGTSGANLWSRNIRGLARKFRVLAVDELADGMTDAPRDDKNFGVAGQVEHLYQFIRAMKLNRVHLVGISNGGFDMLVVALEHADIVKTLTWVSVGAAFRTDSTKMRERVAKCREDTLSADYEKCRMAARAPAPGTFPPEYEKASDWMWNLPKSVEIRKRLAAIRAAGEQNQAAERAYRARIRDKARGGALQVPILLYKGKQDVYDWAADAPHADMRGGIAFFDLVGAKNPRVKLIVLNDAGHFVSREQPEQFNVDLIEFIEHWNSNTSRSRPQ